MNIKYRVMVPNDYREVISLWKNAPEISFSDSDEELRITKYLQDNPNSSFVACDNDKIIGTVLAGDDSRRGFINHLYVLPEYRHNGIGSELLRLSELALSTTNATKSYVFVKRDNSNGITYWKKKNYYLCDDFAVLRKSLSSDRFSVYEELDEDSIKVYLNRIFI